MHSKRVKLIVFGLAGVLLLAALVWTLLLNDGEGARIAAEVNRHGYTLTASDFYTAGSWKDTSIRALLPDTELSAAIAASKRAGYPADVDKAGTVALIMANPRGDDTMMLFFVDGTLEFAFIQVTGTDEIRALNDG